MKVLINDKEYTLTDINKFGGEGDLYTTEYLGETKCVKIYHPEKRTPYNERKIITLINRFKRISMGGIENNIGYPETPVYETTTKKFCGFVMKYFSNHIPIADFKFSNNHFTYGDTELNDEDILTLIDNLFFYLKVLHKTGIILGDVNPENILIEKKSLTPVIVDFDSVQVGSFFSNTKRNDYVDPMVRIDGHGRYKYFIYSTDSDIYSLAIIFYELILGAKPHFFQTTNPTETNYKKTIGLSFLDYFIQNADKIKAHSLEVEKNKTYNALFERLEYLKSNHPNVFNFLKSIFVEEKRYYFYNKQNRLINIEKKHGVTEFKEFELLSQTKEDPDELDFFIKQFDIKLP